MIRVVEVGAFRSLLERGRGRCQLGPECLGCCAGKAAGQHAGRCRRDLSERTRARPPWSPLPCWAEAIKLELKRVRGFAQRLFYGAADKSGHATVGVTGKHLTDGRLIT